MSPNQPLENGTKLGKFEITQHLGSGGFGHTYRAFDSNLHCDVAIKEYFPSDFAERADNGDVIARSPDAVETYDWGRERFLDEARTLESLRHPNIVRVKELFPANNTAYIVMEFEEGQTLASVGDLTERKLIDDMLLPLLDGLEHMHEKNILHRDIKPDNIFIRDDGTPVLIDLGSARDSSSQRHRAHTIIVTPGYSPAEQYESSLDEDPRTDIYALGATIYHVLTGRKPPEGDQRADEDIYVPVVDLTKGYSTQFCSAIDACLKVRMSDRPATVNYLRQMIVKDQGGSTTGTSGSKALKLSLVGVFAALLVGAFYFIDGHVGLDEVTVETTKPSAKPEKPIAVEKEVDQRRSEELEKKKLANEQQKAAEEKKRLDEEQRLADKKRQEEVDKKAAEEKRLADEKRKRDEAKRVAEEKKKQEEKERLAEIERAKALEEKRRTREEELAVAVNLSQGARVARSENLDAVVGVAAATYKKFSACVEKQCSDLNSLHAELEKFRTAEWGVPEEHVQGNLEATDFAELDGWPECPILVTVHETVQTQTKEAGQTRNYCAGPGVPRRLMDPNKVEPVVVSG